MNVTYIQNKFEDLGFFVKKEYYQEYYIFHVYNQEFDSHKDYKYDNYLYCVFIVDENIIFNSKSYSYCEFIKLLNLINFW